MELWTARLKYREWIDGEMDQGVNRHAHSIPREAAENTVFQIDKPTNQ